MKKRKVIKTRFAIPYEDMVKNKSLDSWSKEDELSLCSGCNCMTKTIHCKCGKCGVDKDGKEKEKEDK